MCTRTVSAHHCASVNIKGAVYDINPCVVPGVSACVLLG